MDTAADRGPQPRTREAFSAAPQPAAGAGAGVSAAGNTDEEPSMREPAERVYSTLKRMAGNYATLAVLDVRRAAVQLAWLVGGGIFIAVLVVTAWLAGVIALAVWLLGTGMSWPAVLLIAAALNLAGAATVVFRLRSVFDRMPFEATLRHLKSEEDKGATKRSDV